MLLFILSCYYSSHIHKFKLFVQIILQKIQKKVRYTAFHIYIGADLFDAEIFWKSLLQFYRNFTLFAYVIFTNLRDKVCFFIKSKTNIYFTVKFLKRCKRFFSGYLMNDLVLISVLCNMRQWNI